MIPGGATFGALAPRPVAPAHSAIRLAYPGENDRTLMKDEAEGEWKAYAQWKAYADSFVPGPDGRFGLEIFGLKIDGMHEDNIDEARAAAADGGAPTQTLFGVAFGASFVNEEYGFDPDPGLGQNKGWTWRRMISGHYDVTATFPANTLSRTNRTDWLFWQLRGDPRPGPTLGHVRLDERPHQLFEVVVSAVYWSPSDDPAQSVAA